MSSSPVGALRARLRLVPGGAAAEPAEISDERLIAEFVRGERDAAERIYDRLIQVVEATLFRVLGRRGEDHEDLVQSAFEQILLTLVRKRFAGACSLRTWAATVTTHLALNVIRTRARDRRWLARDGVLGPELDAACASIDVERQVTMRHEVDRVRRILAAMKPEKASALVLHDVLGHEVSEIAALAGVSVPAAQSRLLRARAELEARLEQELASSRPAEGKKP
jgi:RNA polymerase sigma-70 factor (ECF subfamily)